MIALIQQIGSNQQAQYAATKQAPQATATSFEQVLTTKIEQAQLDETIYNELANDYDIRNATFDEVKEIGQKLYDAGAIKVKDLMTLTFDYGRATQYIKAAANGQASANFSMYETAADAFGKRDWLAEFEARAAKDWQYGHFIGHANKTNIIQLLQLMERS